MAGMKDASGQSVNQDCLAAQYLDNGRWISMVADGHGKEGHKCAERLCTVLPGMVSAGLTVGRLKHKPRKPMQPRKLKKLRKRLGRGSLAFFCLHLTFLSL